MSSSNLGILLIIFEKMKYQTAASAQEINPLSGINTLQPVATERSSGISGRVLSKENTKMLTDAVISLSVRFAVYETKLTSQFAEKIKF